MKVTKEEMDEGLSDHKLEIIAKRKKKKKKFKNSFLYSDNLIQWTQEELENTDPKNVGKYYSETAL